MIINDDRLDDKALRVLDVDYSISIPLLKPTRFLITSNDVLHS